MPTSAVASARPFSPRVVDGDTLADRYANTAARQWIASIEVAAQESVDRLGAFRQTRYGRRPMNATAMKKWVARAKDALGMAYVGCHLAPGNRGKGSVVLDVLRACPPASANASDAPPRKRKAWIQIARGEIIWTGRGDANWHSTVRDICSFTKHSVQRLIQRGGIASEAELLSALRLMAKRVALVELATRSRRLERLADSWLLPVRVKDKNLIAVLVGPSAAQDEALLLVSTFLRADMLRDDQVRPVRDLIEAFAAEAIDLEQIAAAVERLRLAA